MVESQPGTDTLACIYINMILSSFHLAKLLLPNPLFLLCQYVMIASMVKRPRTPPTNNPALDYQTADSEHVLKRSRPFGAPEEVKYTRLQVSPIFWLENGLKFYKILIVTLQFALLLIPFFIAINLGIRVFFQSCNS